MSNLRLYATVQNVFRCSASGCSVGNCSQIRHYAWFGGNAGRNSAVVLQGIFAKAGWVALALTLLVTSYLCMTGMHLALIPVAMASIAEVGYDEFVLVVFLCFTLSQGAAALAV